MTPIDLDAPPFERWRPALVRVDAVRALLDLYRVDFRKDAESTTQMVRDAARSLLSTDTLSEFEGIAQTVGVPVDQVLLCNLSYDLIKPGLACSAFAVDGPNGPIHARNLDWWTTGGLLRDETMVFDCRRAGVTRYRLVSWPGFVGCLSGVAPGRFAVTLNTVMSDDAPVIAEPVVFLLRKVLDTATSFEQALTTLRDTPIASDCLLLLTGARQGELAVIERSPTRAAVRHARDGVLIVTNSYRALGSRADRPPNELSTSSDSRTARLEVLLRNPPLSLDDAFSMLADPGVRLGCTVQHMLLDAASGRVTVRLPDSPR